MPEAGSPVRPGRMRLSRRAGFNLQAESKALNGLEAVNVARPTIYGNPFVHDDAKVAVEAYERHCCGGTQTFEMEPGAGLEPIPVRGRYYLTACPACDWVGSSEQCGSDAGSDDSDVYCPSCGDAGCEEDPSEEEVGRHGEAVMQRIFAAESALAAANARAERLTARIEAALTDACRMSSILLMAGEMTAQERRTARAVANGLAFKVRAALAEPAVETQETGTREGEDA